VTLGELGYQSVSILEGGMAAWQKAGLRWSGDSPA